MNLKANEQHTEENLRRLETENIELITKNSTVIEIYLIKTDRIQTIKFRRKMFKPLLFKFKA